MSDPWEAGSGKEPDLLQELPKQLLGLPFRSPGFCLAYLIAGLGLAGLIVYTARLPIVLALLGGCNPLTSYYCGGVLGLMLASVLVAAIISNRLNEIGRWQILE